MSDFLVVKINNLKKIQPNTSWLESQRSFLLSEISKGEKAKEKSRPSLVLPLFHFNILKLLKPSFAIALGIVVLISSVGTVGAISFAQNSLPGDFLYPVKTIVEKTQMSLASSEESKTKLSIKFASQRIDEFTQLVDDPNKKEDLEKTVKDFTAQMVTVKENIDKLKEQNQEKAIEVAELIKAKTPAYEEILTNGTEKLGYVLPEDKEDVKENINEALSEVTKVKELTDEITKEASAETEKESEEPVIEGEEVIVPAENVEDVIESSSFDNINEENPQTEESGDSM